MVNLNRDAYMRTLVPAFKATVMGLDDERRGGSGEEAAVASQEAPWLRVTGACLRLVLDKVLGNDSQQSGLNATQDALSEGPLYEPVTDEASGDKSKGLTRELLSFYRRNVSVPVIYARFGQVCRLEEAYGESCSVLAVREFNEHSAPVALGRTAMRILSCNRWNPIPYLRSETP